VGNYQHRIDRPKDTAEVALHLEGVSIIMEENGPTLEPNWGRGRNGFVEESDSAGYCGRLRILQAEIAERQK